MYGLGLVGYQLRHCPLREQVLVLVQHEGLYKICVLDICCLVPDTGTDVQQKNFDIVVYSTVRTRYLGIFSRQKEVYVNLTY